MSSLCVFLLAKVSSAFSMSYWRNNCLWATPLQGMWICSQRMNPAVSRYKVFFLTKQTLLAYLLDTDFIHLLNNLGLIYLIHLKMCSQLNITNSLQHFWKVQILLEWLRECHVIFAKCLVNRCSQSSSQRETQAHFFKKVSFKYQHLVIMVNQGNNTLVHSLSSKTVVEYLDVQANVQWKIQCVRVWLSPSSMQQMLYGALEACC